MDAFGIAVLQKLLDALDELVAGDFDLFDPGTFRLFVATFVVGVGVVGTRSFSGVVI